MPAGFASEEWFKATDMSDVGTDDTVCVVLILGDTEHQKTFRNDWKKIQVD